MKGTIHISDGRVLPKSVQVSGIRACSGERYDIIFAPQEGDEGTYVVETDIIHWVTGEVLGTTRTSITVV